MINRPHKGFTLIELLVAIAIAGILLGIGVPSFTGAIKNARLNAPAAEIRHALFLARSEAVKGARPVTVCARASDTACGSDWSNGWLVMLEQRSPPPPTDEVVADATGGEIMRIRGQVNDRIDMTVKGSSDRTANGEDDRAWVRFNGGGQIEGDFQNGFFTFCDDRGIDEAVGVNVLLTGNVRGANRNGDDRPVDVFDREMTCP